MSRGMGKVDRVLGELLKELGLEATLSQQGVLERWGELVGPGIAEVTRARAVERGVLFVDVKSSAWLNELNLMRHDLLARLNAGAGEGRVEKLVFTLAGDPPPDSTPGVASRPPNR
jgi:predicted nucleic acid-binding Zn ribbon protein